MIDNKVLISKIRDHVSDNDYEYEKDVDYTQHCDRYDDCFDAGYDKGYSKALHEISNILSGKDIND